MPQLQINASHIEKFLPHRNNEAESVGTAESLILSRFTHQHWNLLLGILACLIYQGHIVWLLWWVVSFQNIISTCSSKVLVIKWLERHILPLRCDINDKKGRNARRSYSSVLPMCILIYSSTGKTTSRMQRWKACGKCCIYVSYCIWYFALVVILVLTLLRIFSSCFRCFLVLVLILIFCLLGGF